MKLNNIIKSISLILILVLTVYGLDAQCPMCRMSAESNLANGGTEGRGLNTGILYLLALPYTLVMVLGFIWYRKRKNIMKDSE